MCIHPCHMINLNTHTMAIRVVEFSRGVYKIRQKSFYFYIHTPFENSTTCTAITHTWHQIFRLDKKNQIRYKFSNLMSQFEITNGFSRHKTFGHYYSMENGLRNWTIFCFLRIICPLGQFQYQIVFFVFCYWLS